MANSIISNRNDDVPSAGDGFLLRQFIWTNNHDDTGCTMGPRDEP